MYDDIKRACLFGTAAESAKVLLGLDVAAQ